MTHVEDGATLHTPRLPWGRTRRAFGWLEPGHDHARGACPPEVVTMLERAAADPVDRTRGWQRCGFCPPGDYGPTPYRTSTGEELLLGDASLLVPGEGRTDWVAPTLVLHYVAEHDYLPPGELLDAVRSAGS